MFCSYKQQHNTRLHGSSHVGFVFRAGNSLKTPLDGAVASRYCNTQCDQEGFGLVYSKFPHQELSIFAVEQSLT